MNGLGLKTTFFDEKPCIQPEGPHSDHTYRLHIGHLGGDREIEFDICRTHLVELRKMINGIVPPVVS